MYLSLKKLSKIMDVVTYSWSMYLCIFDMILQKIVRDLNNNLMSGNDKSQSNSSSYLQSQNSQKVIKNKENPRKLTQEFTIDDEFFSTIVIP